MLYSSLHSEIETGKENLHFFCVLNVTNVEEAHSYGFIHTLIWKIEKLHIEASAVLQYHLNIKLFNININKTSLVSSSNIRNTFSSLISGFCCEAKQGNERHGKSTCHKRRLTEHTVRCRWMNHLGRSQ